MNTCAYVGAPCREHDRSYKRIHLNRQRIFLNVSWPWPDRELTVSWPWIECEMTVTWPWVDRELTVSWPWVDRELTVSWPWANRQPTVSWPIAGIKHKISHCHFLPRLHTCCSQATLFKTKFFYCGLTVKIGHRWPILRFLDHRQLDIDPVGLQWMSDQLVAVAATYSTHNKHKRRKPVLLARLKPAIPTVEQVQTHSLGRTSTGISSSKLCCWNNVAK
jgi:hypothetical protein